MQDVSKECEESAMLIPNYFLLAVLYINRDAFMNHKA